MLEDTFEGLEDDDLEEEADKEVDKVLFEITSGMWRWTGYNAAGNHQDFFPPPPQVNLDSLVQSAQKYLNQRRKGWVDGEEGLGVEGRLRYIVTVMLKTGIFFYKFFFQAWLWIT